MDPEESNEKAVEIVDDSDVEDEVEPLPKIEVVVPEVVPEVVPVEIPEIKQEEAPAAKKKIVKKKSVKKKINTNLGRFV